MDAAGIKVLAEAALVLANAARDQLQAMTGPHEHSKQRWAAIEAMTSVQYGLAWTISELNELEEK